MKMKSAPMFFLLSMLLFATAVTAQEVTAGVRLRSVPDSVVSHVRQQREFLYANDPRYWTQEPEPSSPFLTFIARALSSPVVKWLVYVLVGGLVVFIIYRIIKDNNLVFRRNSRGRQRSGSDAGDDSVQDIEAELQSALSKGDYRSAIRLTYLNTLQLLDDCNLIRLQARATNNDYRQQMQRSPVSAEFNRLTAIYEFVWYGEYQPNHTQFERIHEAFQQFKSSI